METAWREFFGYGAKVFRNLFVLFGIFLIPFYLIALVVLVREQEFLIAFYSTLVIANFILLFYEMIRDSRNFSQGIAVKHFPVTNLIIQIPLAIVVIILSLISLLGTVNPSTGNPDTVTAMGNYFVHWTNMFLGIISIIFMAFRAMMHVKV